MRVLFMGTGDIGLPSLEFLLTGAGDHETAGVVTQPDKPVGRRRMLTAPAIKTRALKAKVAVLQPPSVKKSTALEALAALQPDVIVVMAYGQILPQKLLDLPAIACINLHASLLPRHRGAAPIQAAIREGDATSGITVIHMSAGLDSGDMLLKAPLELDPGETGQTLHDRIALAGPAALAQTLELLASGNAPRLPQIESQATYAPKLVREDGELDWRRPAVELERTIRAYHPWPGTSTWLPEADGGNPRKLKIFPHTRVLPGIGAGAHGVVMGRDKEGLIVATGDGALLVENVQQEGKKRMPLTEFLRGRPLEPGSRLGRYGSV